MGSLPEVFFESMDLKVLLLLTIFAISVASIRGEEEEDLDLPVPPPASLVEFLDQIELNRQGGNGGNWMSNWWKKIMGWWNQRRNGDKGGKGGKGGKGSKGGNEGGEEGEGGDIEPRGRLTDEEMDRFFNSDFDGFLTLSRAEPEDRWNWSDWWDQIQNWWEKQQKGRGGKSGKNGGGKRGKNGNEGGEEGKGGDIEPRGRLTDEEMDRFFNFDFDGFLT